MGATVVSGDAASLEWPEWADHLVMLAVPVLTS